VPDYANLRKTAERLIKTNGKAITLQRETDGAYDPTTGGTTTISSSASGYGILLNFSNSEIDGTTILSSDRKLIYSGEAPQVDDRYINERVVSVNPLDPDETGAIIYICQLRK
jgi:hypothetical protein